MNILHSVEDLQGFSITTRTGEIGSVSDVYFDDNEWTIRHLVVDTGNWLAGREVLISPMAIREADWSTRTLLAELTRQQVEDSPGIDTEKPVSRQHEIELYKYYGYPYYWSGPYLWGEAVSPTVMEKRPFADTERQAVRERIESSRGDAHLRSANEVAGYHIRASDDEIGHVEDFLFADDSWKIELMVVDTRNWWPGKHVMVSPSRITRVEWETRLVVVDATREQVKNSPEYDPQTPPILDRTHGLYRHQSAAR